MDTQEKKKLIKKIIKDFKLEKNHLRRKLKKGRIPFISYVGLLMTKSSTSKLRINQIITMSENERFESGVVVFKGLETSSVSDLVLTENIKSQKNSLTTAGGAFDTTEDSFKRHSEICHEIQQTLNPLPSN